MAAEATHLLGSDTFWPAFVRLLHRWVPFDNALVAWYFPARPPQVELEFDCLTPTVESPLGRYIDGMYRLDPFLHAFDRGLAPGFYRLADVAPDRFRKSEYYEHYFREAVGQDECQLVCHVDNAVLSVSMGADRRYSSAVPRTLAPWLPLLLALVSQQTRLNDTAACRSSVSGVPLSRPIRDALGRFGAGVLSAREAQVARLILQGHSPRSVAQELRISAETVKTHRRHAYVKLGVQTSSALFALFASGIPPSS